MDIERERERERETHRERERERERETSTTEYQDEATVIERDSERYPRGLLRPPGAFESP